MDATKTRQIRRLDIAAGMLIAFGLGYLTLSYFEAAAAIAWACCSIGAVGKIVTASMASPGATAEK